LNKTLESISENPALSHSSSNSGPTLGEKSRNAIKGTRWEAMDNEIDENLGRFLKFVFFYCRDKIILGFPEIKRHFLEDGPKG
jgi:hypothetical protein